MRTWCPPVVSGVVVLLGAAVLGGCAAGPPTGTTEGPATVSTVQPPGSDDTPAPPTGRPTGQPTAGAACPDRPTARGPADNLVVVTVSGPPTAAAGSLVTVSSRLAVLSSGSRIVLTAQGSSVEVLRGSTVVARTPASAGPDVPLPLTAGASYPGQTLPAQVALVACDGSPLPPGTYGLRAVVAYGGDPLGSGAGGSGGAGRFVLVSDPPAAIAVT